MCALPINLVSLYLEIGITCVYFRQACDLTMCKSSTCKYGLTYIPGGTHSIHVGGGTGWTFMGWRLPVIPSVFFESRNLSQFFRSLIFCVVLLISKQTFCCNQWIRKLFIWMFFSNNCLISNRQLSYCCCRVITSDQSFKEQTCPEQEWSWSAAKWSQFTSSLSQIIWRIAFVSTVFTIIKYALFDL